ncbi:MAG: hypothetical protein AAGC47_02970 [Bacteroidota bacterium]
MPNKLYPFLLLILMTVISCSDDENEDPTPTPQNPLPELLTSEVDSITNTSAVVTVELLSEGTSPVVQRGVCYAIQPEPDLQSSFTIESADSDTFTSSITGLTADTEYFVRSYAINNAGVAYGNQLNFITSNESKTVPPEVSTILVNDITMTAASVVGELISEGSSTVLDRGFCFGVNPEPDFNDSFVPADNEENSFTASLEGLEIGTDYFIRAYALNKTDTAFGNELSFMTIPIPTLVDQFVASSNNVNLVLGEDVFFSGEFSTTASWTIEITGQQTGAEKTITGTGLNIDESNSLWDGAADGFPLFDAEPCEVRLTSPDNPDIDEVIQVQLLSPKPFGGDLITDFEADLGQNLIIGDFEFELIPESGIIMNSQALQGSSYLYLEGTDNESGGATDNFFVGLIRLFPDFTGSNYFEVPTLAPSQLYFNMLTFNELSYSRVVLGFIIDTNDSGAYEEGQDEIIDTEFDGIPEHSLGWDDFSISMSQLGIAESDLSRIVGIQIALISLNNLQPSPREPVGFGFDYMAWSVGEPLDF